MNEDMNDLPQAETADPDEVVVALRAAQTLWSRGDTTESLKWLRKAAESASDEGADMRSLQLAKAAAELRAKLFGSNDSGRSTLPPPVGEVSGAHPIASSSYAQSQYAQPAAAESEGLRAAGSFGGSMTASSASPSSLPPAPDAFAGGAAASDEGGLGSSRPVTATQYPSHRPRQRMGLSSPPPGMQSGQRDSAAYAAVPSWSADTERRISSAPPPLPQASLDDYEELEAEPDDEPADDPGSVWSGPDSWRSPDSHSAAPPAVAPLPAALSSAALSSTALSSAALSSAAALPSAPSGVMPPPLPPRGAFADDDGDFSEHTDLPTVVIPPVDENDADIRASTVRDSRRVAASFAAQGNGGSGSSLGSGSLGSSPGQNSWDQQSRNPGWDADGGSSWAAELRNATWGNGSSGHGSSGHGSSGHGSALSSAISSEVDSALGARLDGIGSEPADMDLSQSDLPHKLTARVHHQAVRVSFAPDLRVPGQYVVRPLREGEKAASGERIALLVALEPGVPLV